MTDRVLIAALLASLFVSIAPALGEEADRAAQSQIAVGRLEVMMSESHDILPHLAVPRPPPRPGTSAPSKDEIFDTLELAVLHYNVLSFEACHTGAVGVELCHGPYLPPWLSGKASDFSDAQLDKMIDEATGRLMPLWSALCAKAQKAGAEESVCPME